MPALTIRRSTLLQEIISPSATKLVYGSAADAEDQVRELVQRITPTEARIDYVTSLLRPMLSLGEATSRNAFYAGSRLLTCSTAMARHIVAFVDRRGSAAAAQAWRADAARGVLPPLTVGPLPPNVTGIIYFAKSGSDPDALKVGFTTNLTRRLRDLRAETGEEHQLEAWFVGTLADEAVAHLLLAQQRMTRRGRDWFFIGDPATCQIRGFLASSATPAARHPIISIARAAE